MDKSQNFFLFAISSLALCHDKNMQLTNNNEVSGSEIKLLGKRSWSLTHEQERIRLFELKIPDRINDFAHA